MILPIFLTTKKVPFVFVTGYGRESIEPRFADVPLLRKPVERERLQAALNECLSAGGRKLASV